MGQLVRLLPETRRKKPYKANQPRVLTRIVNKNPPNYIDQPKPRHLKSCARCRKHKTKCNYVATAPGPCSSCARRGVTCQLEIVIPVKRSNVIRGLSEDVRELHVMAAGLARQEKELRRLCLERGVKIEGLEEVDMHEDDEDEIALTPESLLMESSESVSSQSEEVSENSSASPSVSSVSSYSEEKVPVFQIDNACSYTYTQVQCFLDEFNCRLLPYVPVLDKVEDPVKLYNSSKLLFWAIVWVVSGNPAIESSFLRAEFAAQCWAQTPRDVSILQAILVVAAFPTKSCEQSGVEFDTGVFQMLEFARDFAAQIGIDREQQFAQEFSRRTQTGLSESHRANIWCLLFVLSQLYSFKLGLRCDFVPDYVIEKHRYRDSYLGRLLNLSLLQGTILNTLVYYLPLSDSGSFLTNSLTLWRTKLQHFKADETDPTVLVWISVLELSLQLFTPIGSPSDCQECMAQVLDLCKDVFGLIANLNVAKSAIHVKTAVEFSAMAAFKALLSPYNLGSHSAVFAGLFGKLVKLNDYRDSKLVVDVLLEVESSLQVSDGLLQFVDFSSFKSQLMQGLLFDLKNTAKRLKSSTNTSLRSLFAESGMSVESYTARIADFRNSVNMIGIYSDGLLQQLEKSDPYFPDLDTNLESLLKIVV